jgi:hypothetical protein
MGQFSVLHIVTSNFPIIRRILNPIVQKSIDLTSITLRYFPHLSSFPDFQLDMSHALRTGFSFKK